MLRQKMVLGMIVAILVCCIGLAEGIAPGPAPGQPSYKEGELIVKFKRNAAESLETQLGQGKAPGQLRVSASLDDLARKYKVKKIEPVIKNFKAKRQRIENLKKKDKNKLTKREKHLLRRLRRGPKGARVPALDRIYKVDLGLSQSTLPAVADYDADPDVEYAQLNYIYCVMFTEPNDPNFYPEQWALHNDGNAYPVHNCGTASGTSGCDVNAPEAWDVNTGDSSIIVAVIDTGVDYNHLDLSANMWTDANGYHGYDFVNDDNYPMDDHGHGTHCAGTIGAVGDNALDIAGVCWDVNIMAVKCLDSSGYGGSGDFAAGIEYAADSGADVLSNSWGPMLRAPSNPVAEDAIDYAYALGCVIVFAAGNSNDDVAYYSPANYSKTIAVAATDSDDEKAWFSNYGDLIDVAAPGKDILSLRAAGTDMYEVYPSYTPGAAFYPCYDNNSTMYIASGTSMACPHVAGLAALCLSVDPNLDANDLRSLLRTTADDIGDTGRDKKFGYGRINAHSTVFGAKYDPCEASDPFPSDDATGMSVNVDLSWQAGLGAFSHDVYFGPDFNDVNDANSSSDEFKANQCDNAFRQETLEPNTTYYWRIDEKGNDGTTKGDVWSFTMDSNSGIFYVDADANSGGDGTSWLTAFEDLQDGLNKAVWTGDEIWVAEGTYKPDGNDPNNRALSFELVREVAVYGGFDGTESSRGQRDWASNETILSGDINEPNDSNDNSYHVVVGADGAILDGFTVTDGHADASSDWGGGGMFNKQGAPIVRNCTFKFNKAELLGGALANNGSAAVVENCIFTGNSAYYSGFGRGGAVHNYSSSASLANCTFHENSAVDGGAMYHDDFSAPTIRNCQFSRNTATGSGGAMYTGIFCSPLVVNCTFSDNTAGDDGGAMYQFALSHPTVTNCILWSDDATGSGDEVWNFPNCGAEPNFSFCDIEGSGGSDDWDPNLGNDDGNNIDADPCFVNPDANDYHLGASSPCINAGDPDGDYAGQTDIDGDARVIGAIVDIGADETPYRVHNLSKDKWYTTIQAAIDDASTGNEIVVYPGTYYETIDFEGNAITVRSTDPNDWDVVADTIIDGNGASNGVLFNSSEDSDSNLTGFTVTNATSGVSCDFGAYPTISKCIIEDNSSYGVACFNSSEPLITNNIIRGCTSGVGVYLFGSAATVKNSWLYDNAVGISLGWLFSSAATIRNNTIVDNSYGISVNYLFGTSPDIRNCIIWDNNDELKDCAAEYSCIKDCNDAAGTGNICGDANDPCFVDGNNDDFHLASDSPCIDAGDPNGTYTGEVDIDFEDRVMGDDVDMGGDERDPNS